MAGMKTRRGKRTALLVGALAVVVLGVAGWLAWPHLRFWWLFESLGPNAYGLPEYRHRQTGIIFVRVPGGTFWMGTGEDEWKRLIEEEYVGGLGFSTLQAEEWLVGEKPQHCVTLGAFLIAKCEVTQAEWERVMGSNPSDFQGEDQPVEQVSWDDSQEFCRKSGLRLPTEAQWECACRGSIDGPTAAGLEARCWYKSNASGRTHTIGEKQSNGFGLFDMLGNVCEWCEDVYDHTFYSKPETLQVDPVCTAASGLRVVRGGSYGSPARQCRWGYRDSQEPADRNSGIGLRAGYWPLP
jgi:formylglycine-generating enzyme required for sulfatase activity